MDREERIGETENRPTATPPHRPILDLRGVICPLNFVKTKIQIDKMNSDEILEVLLDSGEAIESVPPSVKEEGHEILEEIKIDSYFKLVIKKR